MLIAVFACTCRYIDLWGCACVMWMLPVPEPPLLCQLVPVKLWPRLRSHWKVPFPKEILLTQTSSAQPRKSLCIKSSSEKQRSSRHFSWNSCEPSICRWMCRTHTSVKYQSRTGQIPNGDEENSKPHGGLSSIGQSCAHQLCSSNAKFHSLVFWMWDLMSGKSCTFFWSLILVG